MGTSLSLERPARASPFRCPVWAVGLCPGETCVPSVELAPREAEPLPVSCCRRRPGRDERQEMSAMVARQSFYIDAPVETVFEYFKDPNLTRDAARYELGEVKLTKDGVGTFYTWGFKVAGLRYEGLEVLTDVVPDKHITERSSVALAGLWEYDFEPEGTGTRMIIMFHLRSFC